MTDPSRKINKRQEAAGLAMLESDRAWTVCKFVMCGVAVFSVAFIYCAVTGKGKAVVSISGGLDALFGWALRTIIKYHFPEKNEPLLLRLIGRFRGE
jgi:hypothetical protein